MHLRKRAFAAPKNSFESCYPVEKYNSGFMECCTKRRRGFHGFSRTRHGMVCPRIMTAGFLIGLVAYHAACVRAPEHVGQSHTIDLAGRFCLVEGVSESFQASSAAARNGEKKDAMILVAPVAVIASLTGIGGRGWLECMAAPVFNVGDGFVLEVVLSRDGREEVISRRFFDPGRLKSDRRWMPLSMPIDFMESEAVELRFKLAGGPQGDLVADWLAIASPRIVLERPQP